MPLIKRITLDMFELSDVTSYMVNPVNLLGVPGAGLALEFRKRCPEYVEIYREACRDKTLRIGTVQVIDEIDQPWGIINLPTKRHYASNSDKDDIARGLEALREILSQDKYRYSVVTLPMLGCGLGKADYETVFPLMESYLGNLEATVFICMSPQRTVERPRYLTIAGPLDYGLNQKEHETISWVIDKTLESWGTSLSDYEGIVSGGYPGVDAYVCGSHYGDALVHVKSDVPYQDSYVWKKIEKMPLVVKPDIHRGGVGANLHLGNLLCEIGDDVILFKPKGHNNNRLSAMQTWLKSDKERRDREGLFPKRISVFGEVSDKPTPESTLLQHGDIPY